MNSAQAKNCQNCKKDFLIEPEDFNFYKKVNVPPPTFCSSCRLQRRLARRNEYSFHKRKCDLCGESIVSMYPEKTSFPVYCRKCWYSDRWSAYDYGRDYDFSQNFFEQFKELQDVVPRVALQVDNSINCEYANQIANCKNCYLISSGSDNEDSMYSFRILNSKNVLDGFVMLRAENCYECIEILESSYLKFVENCAASTGLSFCFDARGSQDCFMSSNIWNKKYVFRNRQLSKEEYQKEMQSIDIGSYENITAYLREFNEVRKRAVHKYAYTKNVQNTTGNTISYSKNCVHCFNGADLENCRYCLFVNEAKDSVDINNGCCVMELNYEVSTMGVKASNIKFSSDAWPEVRNLTYCDTCRNGSHDLFGCVGMRKGEYSILNKKYPKEEYEALVRKIIEQMNKAPYTDKKGRVYKYGEFFPIEISPFPYNETPAYDYFPTSKEEAEKEGYLWVDVGSSSHEITILPADLPDHIRDVEDGILKEVIGCGHGGKCADRCTGAFRIVADELQFYRRMNIALPRLCPNCRYYNRFRKRNPIRLWDGQCSCKNRTQHFHGSAPCPNKFKTSYPPDRSKIVYCEQCYQAEVV